MKIKIKILFLCLSVSSFLFANDVKKDQYSKPSFSILKSMVFPGWGELGEYNKYKKDYILKRSKILSFIECALLYGFFTSNSLSESYEDDYRSYAAIHAGVDWTRKSNAFAIQVGKYTSTDGYNNFTNSPAGNSFEQYSINPEDGYWWEWDDNNKKDKYSSLREDSETMRDIRTFMIAGLLINRFVSFFDIIAIKKREENLFSFNLENSNNNANVSLNFNF